MTETNTFTDLALTKPLLRALSDLGYETPFPIQQRSIPVLLSGANLIAQAQTGTGKTAAFALPILQKLNLKQARPQALVLAPTRELAIQVAEAFQSYAKHLPNFHVAPIYGGQDYQPQLRALKRGVHVVVGTPGRVMDHIRRGKLALDHIKTLVLDEADEMLKMGFLEDVKWVLEQMPQDHQGALFSATMPNSIKNVAKTYFTDPQQVKIEAKSITTTNIEQSAMLVSQKNKIEALTRYLEVEMYDAAIVFARTKNSTAEIAHKLAARGYSAAALNGDMSQNLREKVIERVKRNSLDIIVATDVAARGLDVERLSHVINYDAPCDAETYVHRIGRTGRAGRKGKSLLLITPREQHFLRDIERATRLKVDLIDPPSVEALKDSRVENFTKHVLGVLQKGRLDYYRELVEKIAHQHESSELDVAAALLKIAQKDKPLQIHGEDKSLVEKGEFQPRRGSNQPRRKTNRRFADSRSRKHTKPIGPRKRKRKAKQG